jgi:hypothetical protein
MKMARSRRSRSDILVLIARSLSANRRRWLLDALPLGFESDFQQLFDCIRPRGDSRLRPAPIFD